jgi:aryl-alcohol dehydrogenase-like predicted oxidoreductase
MQTTKLGQTDITISAIGLGGMPLSLSDRPDEPTAIAVIHQALNLGITLIDTADSYCIDESDKHHNERLIAKAIAQYPGDTSQVIVATKGGLMRPNGAWTLNGNPEHLRQTIEESFVALGGHKPIDLWQYHAPDPDYSIQAALTPVRAAVEAGMIRYVGVSNFSVDQIKQAQAVVEIVSVQNQFNPWSRQPESDGVLDYCQQAGLTFFPWSPLGGSRRVTKLTEIPILSQLAQSKQASVYQIVLAWLRAKSARIVPIPGASKPESIIDSAQSLQISLSATEVAAIDQQTQA